VTNRFAKAHAYQHKEAFCLMLYQSTQTKRVLDIWNSRDGVTPFIAQIDDEEYTHIAFNFDRCVPDHRPKPGDYFWRDITVDEAVRIAAMRVDHFSPELNESERAARIKEIAPSFLAQGGSRQPYLERAPFITVVDHD
jgi:hypothetical protein